MSHRRGDPDPSVGGSVESELQGREEALATGHPTGDEAELSQGFAPSSLRDPLAVSEALEELHKFHLSVGR